MPNNRLQRLNERRLSLSEDLGPGPSKLMKGIEDAQDALHAALKFAVAPKLVSPAEGKKFHKIKAATKRLFENLEGLEMDLEEWIADYKEHTKAKK